MLDNLVEQRTVVTLYRAPPHLTVAADFNGSALLLRFINRQHQYIVAVTTNVNNDNTGKGPLIKSFFVGMAHLLAKLVSDKICPQKRAYMQQEFSLLRFSHQVKEVVLLIVGARMDSDWFTQDPSPS